MSDHKTIPLILREISLRGVQRAVVALEGDWNATMVTVWTRKKGLFGFSTVTRSHSTFKPSVELCFEGAWLGIHCFNSTKGKHVFDEELAVAILEYVETRCE